MASSSFTVSIRDSSPSPFHMIRWPSTPEPDCPVPSSHKDSNPASVSSRTTPLALHQELYASEIAPSISVAQYDSSFTVMISMINKGCGW